MRGFGAAAGLLVGLASALGVHLVYALPAAAQTPTGPVPATAPGSSPAATSRPESERAAEAPAWRELQLLDLTVEPGSSGRARWKVSESFAGVVLETPVFVVHGARAGPTLCLTAGVHGDELNGVEIVRRAVSATSHEAGDLAGTLVGVPIVNLHGFRRSSRYLPDRRDLNRYFPGRERGSAASRIAFSFFQDVVRHCDYVVDLHTGSFHRTNLPHVRANLDVPETLVLARDFGTSIIVHSVGSEGTLRRAATEAGIPSITYEAGEPMRFEVSDVERGVKGIQNLMRALDMLPGRSGRDSPEVFRRSHWVRCDEGGVLIAQVRLGQRVQEGEVLGTVTDPLSNDTVEIEAPHPGVVIGMAMNQVVMPGFAVFHLGVPDDARLKVPESDEDWAIEAVEESAREADDRPEE